jgi:hypothetical protein
MKTNLFWPWYGDASATSFLDRGSGPFYMISAISNLRRTRRSTVAAIQIVLYKSLHVL